MYLACVSTIAVTRPVRPKMTARRLWNWTFCEATCAAVIAGRHALDYLSDRALRGAPGRHLSSRRSG